jgi:hypothetical protein
MSEDSYTTIISGCSMDPTTFQPVGCTQDERSYSAEGTEEEICKLWSTSDTRKSLCPPNQWGPSPVEPQGQ